jgi:hypothetical protein
MAPDAGGNRDVAVVPLEFRTEERPDGKGGFIPVDWVTLVKKGTNGQTNEERIDSLRKHKPQIWAVVEPAYKHWKTGQEEPTTGTPLSAWTGVSRSQCDVFKLLHIKTVEDVADMNDAAGERYGSGWRALRDRARAYLDAKNNFAATADEVASLRAENKSMSTRLAELEAAFAVQNPVPMQVKGKKAS